MVVNEPEAAPHQFDSPAKYPAASRRMSRSVASLRSLASSSGHPGLQLPHPLVRISGRHRLPRLSARLRNRGDDDTAFSATQHPLTQGRPVDAQVSSDALVLNSSE